MVETAFNLTYNMFVRVLVYASHAYLFWAYRTQALFYLPEGWIGGSTTLLGWIVQSIVALPLAPVGGVGILFWLWCCNQITSRMLS